MFKLWPFYHPAVTAFIKVASDRSLIYFAYGWTYFTKYMSCTSYNALHIKIADFFFVKGSKTLFFWFKQESQTIRANIVTWILCLSEQLLDKNRSLGWLNIKNRTQKNKIKLWILNVIQIGEKLLVFRSFSLSWHGYRHFVHRRVQLFSSFF